MTKILCVDDNELGSMLVRLYLDRVKYESVQVDNGATALDIARQIKPDCVIVDLMMPKITLDGWDTIAAFKSDAELTHIPIIVLTALSVDHAKKRAFDVGCDAFLSKPSNPTELKTCIDSLLGRTDGSPPTGTTPLH